MDDSDNNLLSTVDTTLTIVDTLRELDGARVTQLANRLGMPKSTVHRHLATLLENDYVVRDGDTYRLSFYFLDIGGYVRYSRPLYRNIEPYVEQLANESGERCQFVIEEHGRAVYVHVESRNDETNRRLGKRMYLHSTAVGKSILAHLSEDRVQEIIDRWGLPQQGPHTITTESELFDELADVRERGYAFNRGGFVDGLRSVGAPVFDSNDRILGAISISSPTARMHGDYYEQELPERIIEAINEFEADLEH